MHLYLLGLFLLIFASPISFANDYTEEDFAKDVRYTGQTEITCNGEQYKIPPYLPDMQDKEGNYYKNNFLNVHRAKCENGSLEIEWGIDRGCNGANVCGLGGFYFSNISPQFRELISMNEDSYETVVNIKGVEYGGYYYPPKCYAYCSQAKLVWFNDGITYMLRTKMGDKGEMVKSAQSYINLIKNQD